METKNTKEKIVIVGFGWIGQANAISLFRMEYDVFYYDVMPPKWHYTEKYTSVYEKIKSLEAPLQIDGPNTWYIVCVGDRVSDDGLQDTTFIERALTTLRVAEGKIILRSTVLPKHLKNLPFHLYLPEFLHELYAVEECLNPLYFVVGRRAEGKLPGFLEEWKSRAFKVFEGTPEEASYIKYLSNIWNAARIAFVNELGDSIALPTNDEERKKIERIIDFFFEKKSYLRYGRAFDGHCLPKDTLAFATWKGEYGAVPVLKAVCESNKLHQKITETYPNVPKWFSAWDYSIYQGKMSAFLTRLGRPFSSLKSVRYLRRVSGYIIRFFEQFLPSESMSDLKLKWNKLAAKNSYYYANPDTKSREKVDEFELRQSGEADYLKYVADDATLREVLGETKNKIVLEVGAGVGRMTEFFAKEFQTIYGLDISSVILNVARKRLISEGNIVWAEGIGNVIPCSDDNFDFVFSYLTFKHLPSINSVKAYFLEIKRVLKFGGLAKVQLRAGATPHLWQWFYGVSLTHEAAKTLAERAGLTVIKTEVENKKSLWLWLTKS